MKRFTKPLMALLTAAVVMTSTAATTALTANESVAANPTGTYISELTGLPISQALKNQRPVAIMVDNEKTALPHYGVSQADIVYELMNSTKNGRITRLMCIVKDWANLKQFGSIRSTRSTNVMLAAEYNAILVHDGGPFYINTYLNQPYSNNLSAGFARFSNGKRTEFTEYVTSASYTNTSKGRTYAGLVQRVAAARYTTTYNEYYPGAHFIFAPTEYSLAAHPAAVTATAVDLPYPHNCTKLRYNALTGTYDYYEYGSATPNTDALNGATITFENVILQDCTYTLLDTNGYLIYNCIAVGQPGLYLTNGKAIPIIWSKTSENGPTIYYDATTGEVLTLNPGKTYITLVPSDVWLQTVVRKRFRADRFGFVLINIKKTPAEEIFFCRRFSSSNKRCVRRSATP